MIPLAMGTCAQMGASRPRPTLTFDTSDLSASYEYNVLQRAMVAAPSPDSWGQTGFPSDASKGVQLQSNNANVIGEVSGVWPNYTATYSIVNNKVTAGDSGTGAYTSVATITPTVRDSSGASGTTSGSHIVRVRRDFRFRRAGTQTLAPTSYSWTTNRSDRTIGIYVGNLISALGNSTAQLSVVTNARPNFQDSISAGDFNIVESIAATSLDPLPSDPLILNDFLQVKAESSWTNWTIRDMNGFERGKDAYYSASSGSFISINPLTSPGTVTYQIVITLRHQSAIGGGAQTGVFACNLSLTRT